MAFWARCSDVVGECLSRKGCWRGARPLGPRLMVLIDERSSLWTDYYRLAERVTALAHATYQRGGLPRVSWGYLILRRASRLDAFSAYHFPT